MSKVILLSFAHPDDESFASGGTIAKYAAQGYDIYLVCATRGEAGKVGQPPRCSKEELGKWRERELLNASKVLGIKRVFFLDYYDGKTLEVPIEAGVQKVYKYLVDLRPQIVITFGPDGIYEHPDHQAVSNWTTQAFEKYKSDNGKAKLFYVTIPSNPEGPLGARISKRVKPITALIDISKEGELKKQALKCHESQHLSLDRVLFSQPAKVQQAILEKEYFYHYWPKWNKNEVARDLFEEDNI